MCNCIQKKKEHLGSGNYKYTFECQMDDGSSKRITVTSGNDSEAEQLAELECEEKSARIVTHRNETLLKENIRFVVEFIENCKGAEMIKTFLLDEQSNILPKSVTITCTCYGLSESRICENDGWCDCSSDKPKVVCT